MSVLVSRVVREETYSFTMPGKPTIHIRSGYLRELLHRAAMDKIVELTFPKQTDQELIDGLGLEQARMASMTMLEASDPVIVGELPNGTHMVIDGAHRRWFWHKRGVQKLRGWIIPEDVWSQFTFDPTGPGVIKYHDTGESLPQRRGR